MEEKKSKKISLLIIILIIIIVIIGYYIYKTIASKETSVDNFENNIINNNINEVNNNTTLQGEDAERIAKKTLDKYIKLSNYENNNVGPMPYILVELGLETEEKIDLLCDKSNDPTVYIKSNTKYEDFKKSLLQYVTENYFLENFSQYKNIDGYVGFCNCASSTIVSEIENVALISKDDENKKYVFYVTFKNVEVYEHYLNGEELTKDDYLFNKKISFKYINNNLLISEF